LFDFALVLTINIHPLVTNDIPAGGEGDAFGSQIELNLLIRLSSGKPEEKAFVTAFLCFTFLFSSLTFSTSTHGWQRGQLEGMSHQRLLTLLVVTN
jgi:hypothetical protein